MSPESLAHELGIGAKVLRSWLRDRFPRPAHLKGTPWHLTREQIDAARGRWDRAADLSTRPARSITLSHPGSPTGARSSRTRATSDEAYVLDLCDEVLGERASRQHRFPWLLGDPGRHGTQVSLPVDAFYPRHGLVVEYRERQHDEAVAFFDRRETVSGVGRGEQRRIYDLRREEEIPNHGLRLLVIRPAQLDADGRGRLRRTREHDLSVLSALLLPFRRT